MKRAIGPLLALLAVIAQAQSPGPPGSMAGSAGPKADEFNPPTAAFSCTPLSGPPPLEVDCTDASTGESLSWAWDFGDSGTSTIQNPTHEYAADGQYTVTLVATNAGGSDSEVKAAYVLVSSGPAFPEPIFYLNGSSSTPTYIKAPMTLSSFTSYYESETFGVAGKVGTAVTASGSGFTSSTGYSESLSWLMGTPSVLSREHTCNVWYKIHDNVDELFWPASIWVANQNGNLIGYPTIASSGPTPRQSDSTWSAGAVQAQYDALNYAASTWHMFTIALYADGGNNRIRVWVDGAVLTQINEAPLAVADKAVTTSFIIKLGGTQVFDEFACWNALLTQPDVDALYNSGAGRALPYP